MAAQRGRLANTTFVVAPALAFLALIVTWERDNATWVMLGLGVLLASAVISGVHHAEVVALRVGEPFGSLILAVAVTIIEVGMIVSLMISSPEQSTTLARDTVFSALMIILNGIVGVSLIVKALRKGTAVFKPEGVAGALAAVAVLTTLSLVLPSLTTSTPGPTYTPLQLIFAAVSALVIYLLFVFVQTIRHRDFFLPPSAATGTVEVIPETVHSPPPSKRQTRTSLAFLLVALLSVVGLAKTTSPLLTSVVVDSGLPITLVAVSIAALVLLPESIAAVRAAYFGRSQISLNLAYGSAMASIGLTIPVIAVMSLIFGFSITLGLSSAEIVLFALTVIVTVLTLVYGRATILQGAIHLTLLGAYLVLVINP